MDIDCGRSARVGNRSYSRNDVAFEQVAIEIQLGRVNVRSKIPVRGLAVVFESMLRRVGRPLRCGGERLSFIRQVGRLGGLRDGLLRQRVRILRSLT